MVKINWSFEFKRSDLKLGLVSVSRQQRKLDSY